MLLTDLGWQKTIKIQKECALDLHLEMVCKILSKSHKYITQTETKMIKNPSKCLKKHDNKSERKKGAGKNDTLA